MAIAKFCTCVCTHAQVYRAIVNLLYGCTYVPYKHNTKIQLRHINYTALKHYHTNDC